MDQTYSSVFRELLQNADDAGVSRYLERDSIWLTYRLSMFKSNSTLKLDLMLLKLRRLAIKQDP